jgi:threonine/homoserine/homoserine lactone efflux protein
VSYIPNPFIIPVGIAMGILLAMPFGPVNLLGIQRAVERGFFGGMAAGLGIMAGDGLIALGSSLGVNAISGALRDYRTAIQIVGGLALLAMGVTLYFTRPAITTEHHAGKTSLWDYVWDIPQTFFLTITNPGAVIGMVAIFGGVSSFVEVDSHIDALTMVASIMGGSFIYWFVVSQFISTIRDRLDVVRLGQINRIAGLVMMAFGCVLIAEMVIKRLRFW